jgi:hypothetical protein
MGKKFILYGAGDEVPESGLQRQLSLEEITKLESDVVITGIRAYNVETN